jgi:hypothetical protein
MTVRGMFRRGMRGYIVPMVAGITLSISAFLPWVIIDEVSRPGIPDMWAMWVAGLGAVAALLATLSMITRRNSRHPLLVVGLMALAITFLAWRIVPRTAEQGAQTWAQAVAIAGGASAKAVPQTHALPGSGIYVGIAAAAVIVCFGLTIVIKRVATPYTVADPDDDV